MTFRHRYAPGLGKLWVITPVSNPVRYASRYRLFDKFQTHAAHPHAVNLMVVELALGDRPFEVTQNRDMCKHEAVQLRTWDELWHKENMINIAISRLPADWEYVAWIDADVQFERHDWAEEIVHQLQRYMVVQCWQNAIDLGPTGEFVQTHHGAVWSWMNGRAPLPGRDCYSGYTHYHPGYAWAARREAIDHLGGLFDLGVLGSGDHHMFWALVGRVLERAPQFLSPGYKRALLAWQDRATRHIRQDIGFMPGTITHSWHGKKADRQYTSRWDLIRKHNYDPDFDLKRDWQGVLEFTDQGERMRNDLRRYMSRRNEDSIDTCT